MVLRSCLYGVIALWLAGSAVADDKRLLENKESLYNNIYVYKQDQFVSMNFGFNRRLYTETIVDTADPLDLPVVYTRYMTVGLAYTDHADSILEIGFGGGSTAGYLHRSLPSAEVTSVELDPVIAAFAQKYFGARPDKTFHVVVSDGRLFLRNTSDSYDMILVDAYRGPFVPFHLLTKEFYELARAHLRPGGVLVQNVEPSTMLFDSATRTIGAVFPVLDFYPAEGNIVTVASQGARLSDSDLAAHAAAQQAKDKLRYDLPTLVKGRRFLAAGDATVNRNAKVLTDDFAPVEALKAIEQHNRKWADTQ
ncbi:MAG TPA: fused MFS/spermidine synthase [Steroidobacteraceae bacterium]|jgi:spermidine synthase